MNTKISVIIPNYNGGNTIRKCLEALYRSDYDDFEVIVVDDHSNDNSRDIIQQFPCELIELHEHVGAGKARNIGADASNGEILFFTDADCMVLHDTLTMVAHSLKEAGKQTIVGGSYTIWPADHDFYSKFQSVFIQYAETKHLQNPDYIASHAMGVWAETFFQHKGFENQAYPILEDVDYSHRALAEGLTLQIKETIQVQHNFNFSLAKSLKNAWRKTTYWTMYSIDRGDLLVDSGTASHELKINVISYFINLILLLALLLSGNPIYFVLMVANAAVDIYVNIAFLKFIRHSYGLMFTTKAALYYFVVYPLAVLAGSITGVFKYASQSLRLQRGH